MIDYAYLGTILGALVTVFILSYLYSENPFFRLGEHIFIGLTAGHAVVMGIQNVQNMAIRKIMVGNWLYVIPILIGMAIYTRYTRNYLWMSRYPYAFLIVIGTGLALAGRFESDWFRQTVGTFMNLTDLNGVIILVGTITTLLYFYMSKEQTGTYGKVTQFGRYFLMLYFGITFGNVSMGRISVSIWTVFGLTKTPQIYVVLVSVVVGAALILYNRSKKAVEEAPITIN